MTDALVPAGLELGPTMKIDEDERRQAAVEVRNARKAFGHVDAVSGVTFTVPEGSFTTLLGPSGSGKTTTLRLLAGLDSVDSGEILLRSTVVNSNSVFVPPEKRRLGLVPQSYGLWPHMTVFEQVAYPLRVRAERSRLKERVEQALGVVGLSGYERRYPSELSGGQQQRVAIARAIVYEPTVLLLDEPLSNLDAALRVQMRQELMDLHQRLPISMVYVTHDQFEALSLSDQVIVMQNGRVIERGTPREIYERPRNLETARFVGASNILLGTVKSHQVEGTGVALDCGEAVVKPARPDEMTSFKLGDRVAVAIKPEDVVLGACDGGVRMRAVVEKVSYLGSHNDVIVRLSSGERPRIRAAKSLSVRVGDRIEISLIPEDIRIFPLEGNGAERVAAKPGQ